MTRTKKILIGLVGAILFLIVALVIALSVLNWNAFKPTINEKVSDALGRPFAINGDLTVTWQRPVEVPGWRGWVPWPTVTANDVTVGNPSWSERPEMAKVQRVTFALAPLPLISKNVIIREIQLAGVSANLERLEDGRANWIFTLPESDGEPSAWTIDIDQIEFDQGKIGFRDEPLKADLQLQVDPLGKPIPYAEIAGSKKAPAAEEKKIETGSATAEDKQQGDGVTVTDVDVAEDYHFGWKVEGRYQGLPVKGEGKIGGILALREADRPFPLQAELAAGETHVAVVGTLTDPVNLGALDLRLALSGATMSALYPLTGVTLPDTPRYATSGHLSVRLHEAGGPVFRYRDFKGKVGASDIRGNLTFVLGKPRPKLTGEMSSRQLRMVDLGPLIGVQPETKQQSEKKTEDKVNKDKVLPTQAFRTDRWRDMDADVTLTAERVIYSEKLPLSKVDAHFVLNDGVLTLTPLRFGFVGGTIDSNIKLDGRGKEMTGDVKVGARGLKLRQLFPDVETMKQALGQFNGDIALTGVGNSVSALLGSGNGDLHLIINDGVVSSELMEIAGLNVGNYLLTKLFGDDDVKINCGVADMQMKQGIMTPRVFVFDTESSLVQIEGDINFKNETLDLQLSPESKGLRLFSLRSPLYVKGTFAHPDAGVEVAPLVARGAGAVALGVLLTPVASLLALVVPSTDETEESSKSCGALIKQVREQGSKK